MSSWFACLVVCGEKVGGPFAKFSMLYCLCCNLYVCLHVIISQSSLCSLCLPCLFSGCSCSAWIIYTYIIDSLPSRLNHWPDCCGEIHCPLNSNITLITFNTMTMQGSWTFEWMILSEKYICLRVASGMILHHEFLLAHGRWVKGIWLYKCDFLFIWPTNWYAVPFERFLGLKKGCALYILYRWFNKWTSCEVVVVLSWTFCSC